MLRLSRKTALALEAVLDIAYHARPDPVQSRDITARQGIPQRYLEQILRRLVREGVLRGGAGPRGGYILARERRRVTLGDVVRVVQSLDCDEDPTLSTAALGERVISPIWEGIAADILRRFDEITMENLCRQARGQGIARADGTVPDYTI